MIIFVQTIGGAFLVSAGTSAFQAKLTSSLQASDPKINPIKVIGTGATDIRTVFSSADLPFILRAYVKGIQTAFIVAVTLACACTVLAFAARWQKLQGPDAGRDIEGARVDGGNAEAKAADDADKA